MACTKDIKGMLIFKPMGYVSFCVCESNILEGNCEELFVKPPRKPKAKHTKRKEHKARQKAKESKGWKSQMKKTRVSIH